MTAPFTTHYFEDLRVGMRETLMKTVMNEDVIGFANLSGDHNPIHLSEHFARKTRFGERIAHGLYTASLISAVLGMYLPGPGAVYLSQTLNFRGPVRIGDVVTISVEVAELVPEGRRVLLRCECLVDNKLVLDGEARVSVPTRRAVPPKGCSGAPGVIVSLPAAGPCRLAHSERQRIAFQQAVEHVVLPSAVDAQIGPRETFATEARAFEQADRSLVLGRHAASMRCSRSVAKAKPAAARTAFDI